MPISVFSSFLLYSQSMRLISNTCYNEPRERRPTMIELAIFDLDGVIVDTAKYHYKAWKRLAAELGFFFSEEHNERLKGVSRMRSLEILLEVGGIEKSPEEKEKLAARKNQRSEERRVGKEGRSWWKADQSNKRSE